mmetsp:Transcript_35890/g.94073  ORF Transcript_35890/g.94073 Transcript_35890/m.94073 type:complete len:207 (+) Transcript_35890:453-1073(+)
MACGGIPGGTCCIGMPAIEPIGPIAIGMAGGRCGTGVGALGPDGLNSFTLGLNLNSFAFGFSFVSTFLLSPCASPTGLAETAAGMEADDLSALSLSMTKLSLKVSSSFCTRSRSAAESAGGFDVALPPSAFFDGAVTPRRAGTRYLPGLTAPYLASSATSVVKPRSSRTCTLSACLPPPALICEAMRAASLFFHAKSVESLLSGVV